MGPYQGLVLTAPETAERLPGLRRAGVLHSARLGGFSPDMNLRQTTHVGAEAPTYEDPL